MLAIRSTEWRSDFFLFCFFLKPLQNCRCVVVRLSEEASLEARRGEKATCRELASWPQRDSDFDDKKQAIILTGPSSIAQSRGNSRRPARLDKGQSLLLRLEESTGEQSLLTAGKTGAMWRKLPLLREFRVIDKPALTVALSVDVAVNG